MTDDCKHFSETFACQIYYRLDVVECENLGREAAVYAQKLLVQQRGEGQAVERIHAGIVNTFRIFNNACHTQTDRERMDGEREREREEEEKSK